MFGMEGGFITDETNLAASTGCDTGTIRNDDLPGGTRRNRAGPGLRVQIIRNFMARASGVEKVHEDCISYIYGHHLQ